MKTYWYMKTYWCMKTYWYMKTHWHMNIYWSMNKETWCSTTIWYWQYLQNFSKWVVGIHFISNFIGDKVTFKNILLVCYIVAVSLIVRGNGWTLKKNPATCRESSKLKNIINFILELMVALLSEQVF